MAMPSHTATTGNITGIACGPDTGLYSLGDLVQPHVAGDDLVIGADHADEAGQASSV